MNPTLENETRPKTQKGTLCNVVSSTESSVPEVKQPVSENAKQNEFKGTFEQLKRMNRVRVTVGKATWSSAFTPRGTLCYRADARRRKRVDISDHMVFETITLTIFEMYLANSC
jgi:hypothetical protein